jgi:electron transfer flavoprotein alpha/beta subunit
MKILVPVKRVIDYNVKARVKPDGLGVAHAGNAAYAHRLAELPSR